MTTSHLLARILRCTTFVILFTSVVTSSILLSAATIQDDEKNRKRSELGERQRLVERKMAEVESLFTEIANKIELEEPERAKRLNAAYKQAKERLITQKMAEVVVDLNNEEFAKAEEGIEEIVDNIEALVRLLMNQKPKEQTKQQEMDMLQEWKQNLENMRAEQQKQTAETNKVANKDKTLENLDAQLKKLEAIIAEQKKVVEATEQNDGEGMRAMDRVADKQFKVRQETEGLADAVGKNVAPSDPKDLGDPQNPKDGKPSDGAPKDGKPSDGKPSDGKPSDGKPSDGKPSDGKPSDGKPSDGQQSAQQKPPQPGQKPLEKAADHQRKAEEKLGSGKAQDSKREQQKAIDELENAREELEKERRRIASLPPEAFEQMAQQQRRTRDKALELAKKMEKAPKKPDQGSGDPSAGQQNQKQPGQKQTQEAAQSMQNAAENLDEQDPTQAERQQREAERKIEEALKEIEERLNQLREETREEKLARLEARFREMLDRQKIASIMTIELQDKRNNLGNLRRRDQLLLIRLSTEEFEISELGQQAYDLLLEDGTSIVFPEIVQTLREDLNRAGELLEAERTDQLTQLVQRDIEATLLELLDSLKELKKKSSGGGGGGGGGGGKQPLLRNSAELKMLKARQNRINRITKRLDQMKLDRPGDKELEKEFDRAAEQQADLHEMTERIKEKQQKR